MVNEENLKRLYDGIIEGKELTTKELISYGFYPKDLSDLIEKGSLERIKRGHYSFLAVDNLLYYGKKLIAQKEYDKAKICFEKCYEINPNHLGTCFQLFLKSINDKDYKAVFKYYDVLSTAENSFYQVDNNFYLYLLNIITEIPEKYREYVKYLKLEDIRVDFRDKRYKDAKEHNKMRLTVLQGKLPYALNQINGLIAKNGALTVQDIIVRNLLYQAVAVEKENKSKVLESIKLKNYESIINILEEKQKRYNLSLMDEHILKLTYEIHNIEKTGNIPTIGLIETENLFEAINGHNFSLALELCKNFNEKNNYSNDESELYLLLSILCNLLYNKKKVETLKREDSGKEVVEEKIEIIEEEQNIVEETKEISCVTTSAGTFSEVIGYLMQLDFENAFRTLRKYMDSIQKRDYEFLIVDLIKLSFLEKDMAFIKPMTALTYVSRENFTFDVSTYIQEFYIALSKNKFNEARIYLDIVSKGDKLGQNCILTENLRQVLETTEKNSSYKGDFHEVEKIEQALKNSMQDNLNVTKVKENVFQTNLSKKEEEQKQAVVTKEALLNKKEESSIDNIEIIQSEREFIDRNCKELLVNQGVVLLKPMDKHRRMNVRQIVEKQYPDIVSFEIGREPNKQVVLRYRPTKQVYVDVRGLLELVLKAYADADYDTCINACLQLLQLNEAKTFVYARLGLSYMKKKQMDKAISYLTIATELSKKEDGQFDFEGLIARLTGVITKKDAKPRVQMSVDEFNKEPDYFGIENMVEINDYVYESGLSVEKACQELGMSEEQIQIVLIIYAREYYSQGDYDKGDEFLRSVEKGPGKTNFVSKLLTEIRKNKKFYVNRADEDAVHLVLTLQPR